MLSSMRRHSLRLQHELHRWSVCDPASSQPVPVPDRPVRRVIRSKSCISSTGESSGSQESWSSSDSVVSAGSAGGTPGRGGGDPFRVVLLGGSDVGKTAFASIFAGAADSMDGEDREVYGGEKLRRCGFTILMLGGPGLGRGKRGPSRFVAAPS